MEVVRDMIWGERDGAGTCHYMSCQLVDGFF